MAESSRAVTNSGSTADGEEEKVKVNDVCRKWRVYEDGAIAHRMQEEEFGWKYGINRLNRRTVREDIPYARTQQQEEEERLQQERMQQLMEQKRQAEEDERVAKQIYEEMIQREKEEMRHKELDDLEMARQMQEREKKKYERKVKERELAKERRRIEQALEAETRKLELMKAGYRLEDRGSRLQSSGSEAEAALSFDDETGIHQGVGSMQLNDSEEGLLRRDGKVEDLGDFTDFYLQPGLHMDDSQKRHLQEVQDEELARLLQDQEHKRGGNFQRDKMKAIEAQDAELARVIQEQERLRAKKHRHKQRQMSVPAVTQDTQQPLPARSHSIQSDHQIALPEDRYPQHPHSGQVSPRSMSDHSTRSEGSPRMNGFQHSPDITHNIQNVQNSGRLPPENNVSYASTEESTAYRPTQTSGSAALVSSPLHGNTTQNIVAAIDPTFNPDHGGAPGSPHSSAGSPTHPDPGAYLPPVTRPSPPPASPTGVPPGMEGIYSEVTEEDQFTGPVQGQKRSTLKRGKKGSKKGSCKQQ